MAVVEPHKELRFTRLRQATAFGILAAVSIMAAIVFFLLHQYRAEHPELPHPAWGLIPLCLGALAIRLSVRCARHAYLILSPLGVEVFPFFRPETGMQLIPWGQIHHLDSRSDRLTLHYNAEETAGIHLSLGPIAQTQRRLLERALNGRLSN